MSAMKIEIVKLLKEIQYREHIMERLKQFIAELDEVKDRKRFDRKSSKKSQTLFSMV